MAKTFGKKTAKLRTNLAKGASLGGGKFPSASFPSAKGAGFGGVGSIGKNRASKGGDSDAPGADASRDAVARVGDGERSSTAKLKSPFGKGGASFRGVRGKLDRFPSARAGLGAVGKGGSIIRESLGRSRHGKDGKRSDSSAAAAEPLWASCHGRTSSAPPAAAPRPDDAPAGSGARINPFLEDDDDDGEGEEDPLAAFYKTAGVRGTTTEARPPNYGTGACDPDDFIVDPDDFLADGPEGIADGASGTGGGGGGGSAQNGEKAQSRHEPKPSVSNPFDDDESSCGTGAPFANVEKKSKDDSRAEGLPQDSRNESRLPPPAPKPLLSPTPEHRSTDFGGGNPFEDGDPSDKARAHTPIATKSVSRDGGLPQDRRNEPPPAPKPLLSPEPVRRATYSGGNPFAVDGPSDKVRANAPIAKGQDNLSFLFAVNARPAAPTKEAVDRARSSDADPALPAAPPKEAKITEEVATPPVAESKIQSGTSSGGANAGLEEFLIRTRNRTDDSDWLQEFLVRVRGQTDEWLDKVYGSETNKNQSSEGKLTTSLCEDVFYYAKIQLRTLREHLSDKSNFDALVLAVCVILSHMRSKQIHARDDLLQDLETCCAASNDFHRMSEQCEETISELASQCAEFSEDAIATVQAASDELVGVYGSDAVYAARSVHVHVFVPIEEEIGTRLFEEEWEETLVNNDLAISLVRTLEDFHEDLERFMDEFMVAKSMMSLMSATVIFYVKCLLQRADKHRYEGNNERPFFGDVSRALERMAGDIKVMREYFEGLVPKIPPLKKNIEKDFDILDTIYELMSVAAGLSVSDAEDFILVLQKHVRDDGMVKNIVADIWRLVAPTEARRVWRLVGSMKEQLAAIASVEDGFALEVNDRSYVKGLRLGEMAGMHYAEIRKNRLTEPTAVESMSDAELVYRHLSDEYKTRIKPKISASTGRLSEQYRTRVKPKVSASTSQLSEEYNTKVKPQISASTTRLREQSRTGLRKMRSEWDVSMDKLQKIIKD